jgi:hypothetical protein
MGDHELEFSGKFGLPEFKGFAAHLEARYKGTWKGRAEKFLDAIEESGLDAHDFNERLDRDEQLRDILWVALDRAAHVGDPEYISSLGRLVAAACDEAAIDDVEYTTSQIVKLEPLQLRLLLMGFHYRSRASAAEVTREDADSYFNVEVSAFYQGVLARSNPAAAKQALDGLESAGFLERSSTLDYKVTLWAILCHDLMFPGLKHLGVLVPDPNRRFEPKGT